MTFVTATRGRRAMCLVNQFQSFTLIGIAEVHFMSVNFVVGVSDY